MTSEDPKPKPVWAQDPFEHLELVERVLALALAVPRVPVGRPFEVQDFPPDSEAARMERERAQLALGLAFDALHALLSRDGSKLRDISAHYMEIEGTTAIIHELWVFMAERWAGSNRHRADRMALIERLVQVRERIIDKLRVLRPDPQVISESEKVALLSGLGLRPQSPPWSKLSDTQKDIFRALSVRRLQRGELAKAVKKSEGAVKKALVPLMEPKHGFIENVDGGGYVTVRLPIGHPEDVKVTP